MTEAVRIATLVDPSSKHLIAAEMSSEDMKNLLIEHTKQVISRTTAASNFTGSLSSTSESTSTDNTASTATGDDAGDIQSCQSPAQSQPSKKRKLLEKASQKASTGPYSSNGVNVESEVTTYIHLQMAEHEANPLVFWKKQEHKFPNLSVLAKCYLTTSASSVPVEAMFSTCGLILNSKRCSMAPYRANMLSVICMTIIPSFSQRPVLLLPLCQLLTLIRTELLLTLNVQL